VAQESWKLFQVSKKAYLFVTSFDLVAVVSGVLDFLCVDDNFDLKNASQSSVLFTTDKELPYTAFFADFGPLNLGLTYKFCQKLDVLITESRGQRVVYYSSTHPHRRANSAVLLCAYMVREALLRDETLFDTNKHRYL
jgi:hypothetical protein